MLALGILRLEREVMASAWGTAEVGVLEEFTAGDMEPRARRVWYEFRHPSLHTKYGQLTDNCQ